MGTIHIPVKLEIQDYQNSIKLSNEKSLYVFYGFFTSALVGNIIVNDISGIAYTILIFAVWEIYSRVSQKKQFNSNKLTHKEVVYNFTENGIEVVNVDGSGNSNIKWDELYGVKQGRKIILLMTGKSSGLIIPKRLLDATQYGELEALIKNKLGLKAFIKINLLKYVTIGVLVHVVTLFFAAALNVSEQRLSQGFTIHSVVTLVQLILLILTFGSGLVFIVQLFRWVYGLFVSNSSIKFVKVFIPFLAFVIMVVVIGFVDYYVYGVWKLHEY